jgi:hypothetical protein
MNSPEEVLLSPCVRLFIELLLSETDNQESSQAPTISPWVEFSRLRGASRAKEELSLPA